MRAHRLSTTTAFRLAFGLLLLGSGLLHPGSRGLAQTSEPDSVFEATGFQKNRAYFSQLPFENIDMVSGNLVLTFAVGAESAPRTALPASVEELAIAEDPAAVALERRAAGQVERRELPLSGLVVTTSSPSGEAVQSQAHKDGEVLVVTSEQTVTLPGGGAVTVTTVQRHTVLPDGRLQVETTRTSGGRTRASRALYVRLP